MLVNPQVHALDLDIAANPTNIKIQPTMYGIFFEDINFSADGGLYAEMVKNRSFEFESLLIGWKQPNSNRFTFNEQSGIANIIHTAENKTNKNSRVLRSITIRATKLLTKGSAAWVLNKMRSITSR